MIYQGSDKATQKINPDKLKMAQVIDRESRMKNDLQTGDESGSDEEVGTTADDMGDEENPLEQTEETKERKPKRSSNQPKKAARPNNQKFQEIMKADDAFPNLENNNEYADEYDPEEP